MPETHVLTVWLLRIEAITASEFASLNRSLSGAERAFSSKLRNADAQRRYVASHALARRMVADNYQVSLAGLDYSADENGRPSLFDIKTGTHIPISLSRTEGLVASAFSIDVDFGIDIERKISANADRQLVQSMFSQPEQDMLQDLTGDLFEDAFFQVWTLKEAYVKAEGLGLSLPLHDFAFTLSPPKIRFLGKDGRKEQDWEFLTQMSTDYHRLSAAVRTQGRPVALDVRHIPISYLLSESGKGNGC